MGGCGTILVGLVLLVIFPPLGILVILVGLFAPNTGSVRAAIRAEHAAERRRERRRQRWEYANKHPMRFVIAWCGLGWGFYWLFTHKQIAGPAFDHAIEWLKGKR